MREIPLTQGYVTWVSEEDLPTVSGLRLWAVVNRKTGSVYAQTTIEGRNVYLHRLLLGATAGQQVDHRHGTNPIQDRPDVVDNRRENLRLATGIENARGFRISCRRQTSAYRGVHWAAGRGKERWCAGIRYDGRDHKLGLYDSEEVAARVYDEVARKVFGEFAQLNFPEGSPAGHTLRSLGHRVKRNAFSKFRGVSDSRSKKNPFRAQIAVNGRLIYLGSFPSEEAAALAHDRASSEIYPGNSLRLNFPANIALHKTAFQTH